MPIRRRASLLLAVAVAALGAAALVALSRPARESSPLVREPSDSTVGGPIACPEGGFGPDMVRLPEGFCIDATEVSRAQYAAWLETTPDVGSQSGTCSTNDDFMPSCAFSLGDEADLPVVCVDWCDAQAFCEASGRRLCGAIGGGTYDFDDYDDPAVSEWQAACSSGGAHEYTYGDVLDTAVCRSADAEDYTTWGTGDVGSFDGCHSPEAPYAAVFDLSGNVAEWDGACDGEEGCHIRGGSYQHNEHGLRCAMGRELRWPRNLAVDAVGFRCCADGT